MICTNKDKHTIAYQCLHICASGDVMTYVICAPENANEPSSHTFWQNRTFRPPRHFIVKLRSSPISALSEYTGCRFDGLNLSMKRRGHGAAGCSSNSFNKSLYSNI